MRLGRDTLGDMRSWNRLFAQLIRRAGRLRGVIIRPSRWVDELSVWAGGRELLHADAPGLIDIRLSRGLIRALGPSLRHDPRIVLRKTPSDWLRVRMSAPKDIPFVLRLLQRATADRSRGVTRAEERS